MRNKTWIFWDVFGCETNSVDLVRAFNPLPCSLVSLVEVGYVCGKGKAYMHRVNHSMDESALKQISARSATKP
jgi:hypothetical protein